MRVSTPSAQSARARAYRSRRAKPEPWRANGTNGSSRRHPVSDGKKWEDLRDRVHEALRDAAGDDVWERGDADDLWREDAELRKVVRPVLADAGETAQFLAVKGLVLSGEARESFHDWLYEDLAAALRRLMRVALGDYSDDKYAARFPKFEGNDSGETPQQLFEAWVAERKPARGSVESWRYVFAAMTKHFKDRSGGSITADEAQDVDKQPHRQTLSEHCSQELDNRQQDCVRLGS